MYTARTAAQATAIDEVATLEQKLEQDDKAELRDMYLDRLRLARDEIVAMLRGDVAAAERTVLTDLSRAVATSEAVLLQVWNSYHDAETRASRPSTP